MKSLKPGAFPALDDMSKRSISAMGKLAWGVCYGAGFGLGLGGAFFLMQNRRRHAGVRVP